MKLFLVLIVLFASIRLSAQTTAAIPLTISTDISTDIAQYIVFGVDSRATDCIDTGLGEIDLPAFPPQILYAFSTSLCPKDSLGISTKIDYRPIPLQQRFMKKYLLNVQRSSASTLLIFEWDKNLSKYIDSAQIRYDVTPTINLLNVSLKDSSRAVITNKFWNDFDVYIWYNIPVNSVNDEISVSKDETPFPNPTSGFCSIKTMEYRGGFYDIANEYGHKLVLRQKIDEETTQIDLQNYASGVYFIRLYGANGKSSLKKIIHN